MKANSSATGLTSSTEHTGCQSLYSPRNREIWVQASASSQLVGELLGCRPPEPQRLHIAREESRGWMCQDLLGAGPQSLHAPFYQTPQETDSAWWLTM